MYWPEASQRVQWLRLALALPGARVPSLVGELRCPTSCTVQPKKRKYWPDPFICFSMIAVEVLAYTSITWCNYIFLFVVRIIKSPSRCDVYNTVLYIITILPIRSPGLVHILEICTLKQHLSCWPSPSCWKPPCHSLFLLAFLDSRCKWDHREFVFLWLTSLSTVSSRSIHVVANGRISFFLMAE